MNSISIETSLLKKALFELKYSYKKGVKVIPILEDVYIQIKKDFIYFKLFDLELETTVKIELENSFDQRFTLNYETFKMFISKSMDLLTTINLETDKATIICGNTKIQLPLGDASEYPITENSDQEAIFDDELSDFKDSLRKAIQFAGNDDLRPVMSGINVSGDKETGTINIASTDAHKLYYNQIERELNKDFDFILTANTAKLISGIDSTINFLLSERNIVGIYETSDYKVRFTSVLIDGKFPNYKAVIPKDNDIIFSLNKKDLLAKLDILSLTISENNSVKFAIEPGVVNLSSENIDFNKSSTATIEIEEEENLNDPINIGYNINFLTTIIKTINDTAIKFKISAPEKASLLSIKDNDSKELFLLMPVMLN